MDFFEFDPNEWINGFISDNFGSSELSDHMDLIIRLAVKIIGAIIAFHP